MSPIQRLVAMMLSFMMQMPPSAKADDDQQTSGKVEDHLLHALITGDLELLKACIQKGARVNQLICIEGSLLYPIHLACLAGEAKSVDLLIEAHVDIDVQSMDGETPLYMAAELGHYRIVESLLKAQANVDCQQIQGFSPINIASHCGHYKIVDILLKALASLDFQANNGSTPLFAAVKQNHSDLVDLLTKAQASANTQERDGFSPLHVASESGFCQSVAKLIKAQADANLQANDGSSPLFLAAQNGHRDVACMLIEAGADANLSQEMGASPLHIASQEGHTNIVGALVAAQADVNMQQEQGASPLYIASQGGKHEIACCLIAAQANPDVKAGNGCAALHIATHCGHLKVVEALLKGGADVNIRTNDGSTPMYIACEQGYGELVAAFLQVQADVTLQRGSGESPLYIASENDHYQIVQKLIQCQSDVDHPGKSGLSPLYTASQLGHQDVVAALLEAQADANLQQKRGASPLHVASQFGYQRIVSMLIEGGANVDLQQNQGGTPLYMAAQGGHGSIVDLLICAEADVNLQAKSGCTPLYIASEKGHHQIVNELVRAHAGVNIQRATGETPLYAAAQHGHHHAVEILIQAEADVNLQEIEGFAPLHIASQNGHQQVVKTLIKASAAVDQQQNRGSSALYIAAQWGHAAVVEALISAQADVNLQQKQGASPLHAASQAGRHQIVDRLVTAGAIVDLLTRSGRSALHFASEVGNCQVVDVLLAACADVNLQSGAAGESPLYVACQNGHHRVVKALVVAFADTSLRSGTGELPLCAALKNGHTEVVDVLSRAQVEDPTDSTSFLMQQVTVPAPIRASHNAEENLSLELHSRVAQSGFVKSTAALQSAVADVLQQILRKREPKQQRDHLFVVGSFSEGWGNSLVCANGKTDIESDIDVMQLIPGRLYHLEEHCGCTNLEAVQKVKYSNGHIFSPGFASSPAKPEQGSSLRPAVDRVSACRLCCYPPIAPLQPSRVSKSNIPQSVLEALEQELWTSPCHAVHAAAPGQAGKQLRVSTTFLENRLLRSLSSLQGQLFVTLKYLVKKVICRRVQGVKAYHAKTITFRMLEETPKEKWRPENLVSLTRQALEMLHDSVDSSSRSKNAHGRIMEHFFLCDAALYLKGADRSGAKEIAQTLRDVIQDLPQLLQQFQSSLNPMAAERFYFHPFAILPILDPMVETNSSSVLEYHEIYDVVRLALLELSQAENDSDDSLELLVEKLGRLPDCACAAREAIRALTCLKFGYRDAAAQVLRGYVNSGHQVSRGITWSHDLSEADATAEFVWQQLKESDSVWKFAFWFDQRPLLAFLPNFLASCFPKKLGDINRNVYYANFDALISCLRLELMAPEDGTMVEAASNSWIDEVVQRDDIDVQELQMVMHYCTDRARAARLLRRHRKVLLSDYVAREQLKDLEAELVIRESGVLLEELGRPEERD